MDGARREQDALYKPPDHLHNLQPRHQEESNHVTFHRLDYAADLALPVSFLGVTLLGIIFVLIVLVLWWRNHAPWRLKDDGKMDCGNIRDKVSRDPPRIVEEARGDKLNVKYVDERERVKPTVVTTRNYGGSSPKVPEEEKEEEKQFVFPPEDKGNAPQAGTSRSSEPTEQTKLKIPMPEQTWLSKKPFEYKTYRATIPRQLAEVVRTELGGDLNVQERTKKFSATRSPSLEKDDKSPFVSSATYDKVDVFAFEPDKIKKFSTGNNSPVIEMRVQPQNEHIVSIVDRNFNNNVTPISPKLANDLQRPSNVEHLRTSSLDADNDNKEKTNLRRFRSVNTKLNICSATDVSVEMPQERLEMQNSPRIVECNSATEKSTKFNFSPKFLGESQNSPKFFTPTDKFSPRFFPEGSPKSVYYDSVRSPKFFPDTPKSPAIQDERSSLSPKAFTDQNNRNSPRNSPKLFGLEQHSPRFLSGKPRSPKVYSGNKENYFDFDSKTTHVELARLDEVDNASAIKKASYIQRYGGRKSIERERITTPEKLDVRRYRRHNSCDTYKQNVDNGNTSAVTMYNNDKVNERLKIDGTVGEDVLDCCVQVESMRISPTREENSETLTPNTQTAQQRRQRLKSISLDSDNARIIEQNLGLPIAKHMKQDNLNEALQDYSSSCCNVKRSGTCEAGGQNKFTFDRVEILKVESKDFFADESKYSPDLNAQKKSLRDASDTKSFIDMPRFSPKEFEVIITVDEDQETSAQKRKVNRNPRNLTIDLTRRDSDLEKELLEFEKLYTDSGDQKVRTPTLKIKATSLDSSESMNLSLPQKKSLEVPQNSVSVPNTPKRHLRILAQRNLRGHEMHSGGKMGYNSLQSEQRRFVKWQPVHPDSGIFLKENHANLMLYQPSTSRANARRMGSFDENMADFAEHPPEINVNECDNTSNFSHHGESSQCGVLGSNLLSFKQNLSVSSTNLKTLPEGVPSNDFEPSVDEKVSKKLNRRGSNQSLKLSLDQGGKYSTYSLQSSNCSLSSAGLSCHNLASIRNSASNFSLNTDNRQKILERRNSNTSLTLTTDHLTPVTRITGSSNANLQASNTNLSGDGQPQPAKNCLLQRRGSNNSLTLNIQNSSPNLTRFSSNSSLNINKDAKAGQRKGLLERRSSNTSLTLNINSSNPQLTTTRCLSISNYNLNGSSLHNSNQSINNPPEPKKGILERRSSNTSLTINIENQDVPRDIEVDEKVLESSLKDPQFMPQKDKHRKSLSTENLIPKSYKNRNQAMKNNESVSFGSHDDLWSNSYVAEVLQESCGQNLTYVGGDPENEIIYAFGTRQNLEEDQGMVRNITTKPLSPQTTSEDFKTYLANIQHLQNASSVLTRKQLKDLNNVFQNGYSKVKCDGSDENGHRCSPRDPSAESSQMTFPETELPCSEYQKLLLRNLHKEFWDLPSNFQEKPMVFGSHPKNRYKTILPNEHSRFILKTDGAVAGEGYVNANFIKGHEYTKNSYIATQGPLQNTIYDFWSMVRQNSCAFSGERNLGARPKVDRVDSKVNAKVGSKVQKIVMLTNFVENNRPKCEKYFPLEVDEELVFENPEEMGNIFSDAPSEDSVKNSFVIKNRGIINKTGYTIRRLQVCYRQSREQTCNTSANKTEVEVYHYWFHNWADHKCPKDVNALLNLSLDILNSCTYDFDALCYDSGKCQSDTRSNSDPITKFVFPPLEETVASYSSLPKPIPSVSCEEEGDPPTIVHCSAGIGRTGCLIAILNGIKQLNYDQKVDILGIVCNMRLNRGGMVQNSEQYELIHKVLCLYEQMCLPNL